MRSHGRRTLLGRKWIELERNVIVKLSNAQNQQKIYLEFDEKSPDFGAIWFSGTSTFNFQLNAIDAIVFNHLDTQKPQQKNPVPRRNCLAKVATH